MESAVKDQGEFGAPNQPNPENAALAGGFVLSGIAYRVADTATSSASATGMSVSENEWALRWN